MGRLLTALAFVALAAPSAYKIVDVRSAFAASGDAECGEISCPVSRDGDAFARNDLPQRASGA